MTNPKRALVTLPDGVWRIIKNDLKGKLGDGDSEVIRNIVISYLTEKGYFVAQKVQPSTINAQYRKSVIDLINVSNILGTKVAAIIELLNDNKIIPYPVLEARKKKIQEAHNLDDEGRAR